MFSGVWCPSAARVRGRRRPRIEARVSPETPAPEMAILMACGAPQRGSSLDESAAKSGSCIGRPGPQSDDGGQCDGLPRLVLAHCLTPSLSQLVRSCLCATNGSLVSRKHPNDWSRPMFPQCETV
jgi:hypothetical protein